MKVVLEPMRADRFSLGWARNLRADGVAYGISVRPGKRVRLAYSSKFGYHWSATVYRIGSGEVATFRVEKSQGAKSILVEALYREFCRLAWREPAGIDDALFNRAERHGFRGDADAALKRVRDIYYEVEREARHARRGIV